MKKLLLALALTACTLPLCAQYIPSEGNLKAREDFARSRLGIFLHWGIYSSYAQGEWYLSTHQLDPQAYKEAASGFYPARFDAAAWAKAFKDAGAGYVTLTSRHHDGFSMFDTAATDFDIMDATPFRRDVLKELTQAVKAEGLAMQYYYSLLDWLRPDYPKGSSGVPKDSTMANYNHYFQFEKTQIAELLQNHPRALWFDGSWDHEEEGFDWRLEELYAYIHSIAPDCLVGNNHHKAVKQGEDFQMFEKDLPGENSAGFSGTSVISATLPLETCETMNYAWGYRVEDQNYKSVKELVHLLVKAVSKGANLLLNIGPEANGCLPAPALDRLKGLGEWMRKWGHTVNGCGATGLPAEPWGVTTRDARHLYIHILEPDKAPATYTFQGRTIKLPKDGADAIDTIVTIDL